VTGSSQPIFGTRESRRASPRLRSRSPMPAASLSEGHPADRASQLADIRDGGNRRGGSSAVIAPWPRRRRASRRPAHDRADTSSGRGAPAHRIPEWVNRWLLLSRVSPRKWTCTSSSVGLVSPFFGNFGSGGPSVTARISGWTTKRHVQRVDGRGDWAAFLRAARKSRANHAES
jgi:hypothetical protein